MNQLFQLAKEQFELSLDTAAIPLETRRVFRKWLAYYWDYCTKNDDPLLAHSSQAASLTRLAQ